MATLQDAITQAAALVAGLTGIKGAPANPTEQISQFPFCQVYPGEGTASFGVIGERLNLDTIIIELHVARKDLPRDVAAALPYVDTIPNVLMDGVLDDKWSATIDTFENVTWTFGALNWAGQETLGFRFSVNGVKRRVNIT